MFTATTIRTKLLVALMAMSIVPFAVVGVIMLLNSSRVLSSLAFGQLESLREVKKIQIRHYFDEREKNMTILMETVGSLQQAAFEKLRTVQDIKKAQVEEYFRKCLSDIRVISNNYTVLKALDDFGSTLDEKGNIDGDLYNFFENVKYGNSLKQFKKEYGYYDLLLATKAGNIVYSLNREKDLGQNLITGPLRDKGPGKCFRQAQTGIVVQDFEPYSYSNNSHMAFVCARVDAKYGTAQGVVILKLHKKALNSIVQRRKGMGKSGETYLVSSRGGRTFYRSDRIIRAGRFGEETSDGAVGKAVSGISDTEVRAGQGGTMRIVSYDPLEIYGLKWAMITVMDLEEAIAPQLEKEEKDYFGKYVNTYGYIDLLLITPSGDVFYSVGHQEEYRTNLVQGKYSDSGLGSLFRKIMETRTFGFSDFQPHDPSEGKPTAFIGQPVVNDGRVALVVALQMSYDAINSVMQERSGMGSTGETYLVGPDKIMRSDSYRDPEDYSVFTSFILPETSRIDTLASREALSGKSGERIIVNYFGSRVLSAYAPIRVWDTTWALVAEIDAAEAFAPVAALRYLVGLTALIGIALVAVISFLMARRFSGPIKRLTEAAEEISRGRLDIALAPAVMAPRDEVGLLANAFNTMTERLKRTMEDLKDQISERQRLSTIIESTSDLVSLTMADGQVTYMNRAGRRMVGWSEDEDITRKRIPDVHPEWAFRLVGDTGIPTAVEKGIWEGETALLGPDGGEIPVSQVIMSHKSLGGTLEHLSTIMRDISEQKRSEKELQRLRNLLTNIVNSMPSVLVGVDRDDQVMQWNSEAEKATGVTADEAQGRNLEEVFPQLAGEIEKVRLAIRDRQPKKDAKVALVEDGEIRYSDVTVYPLVANGIEGAVIRVDDVTDRVRIEEMMIQTEKMLSVGGLAAGMAHEINNPLAGMLQSAQVVLNRVSKELPANRRVAEDLGVDLETIYQYMERRGLLEMLDAIKSSGRRAAQIVDNMLSFSRKSESKFNTCDMQELLDNTLILAENDYDLKKKFDFRNIEIVREYDQDLPLICCEKTEIQQVVLNLVKNAAHAISDQEGRTTPPKIILRLGQEDDMALIEVEDNGPGMEEATRKRVFEPFYTTKSPGVGTGLGLSVSYFIVTENHKGTLSVESTPGQGTRFIVRLPQK
ncbi:MAG: PAS domain S-box protein [Proteobacteria bacterium]|nr:PAS domain S-box protein [Pseudomonadota bacterium]